MRNHNVVLASRVHKQYLNSRSLGRTPEHSSTVLDLSSHFKTSDAVRSVLKVTIGIIMSNGHQKTSAGGDTLLQIRQRRTPASPSEDAPCAEEWPCVHALTAWAASLNNGTDMCT